LAPTLGRGDVLEGALLGAVAKRQLALYHRLRSDGALRHNYLFFTASGDPIESVLYTAERWRSTLRRLPIRYRRPYCARHTSVSWNLITGKNPLYVSRQHGHSVETMWRVYSAWMEGAMESDIALIKASMDRTPRTEVEDSTMGNAVRVRKETLSERLRSAVSKLPRFWSLARIWQ